MMRVELLRKTLSSAWILLLREKAVLRIPTDTSDEDVERLEAFARKAFTTKGAGRFHTPLPPDGVARAKVRFPLPDKKFRTTFRTNDRRHAALFTVEEA